MFELEPIETINDTDIYSSGIGATNGNMIEAEGCVVSVYDTNDFNKVIIRRKGTSTVMFLYSNNLYLDRSSDRLNCIHKQGTETEYTLNYRYVYITTTRSSSSSYGAYVLGSLLERIGEIETNKLDAPISAINADGRFLKKSTNGSTWSPIEYDIEPISTINDADISIDGNNGYITNSVGSVVSIYDVGEYNKVFVSRPQSSAVAFLVSDNLYTAPSSARSTAIQVDGSELIYTTTKKYLYITTSRTGNYSAQVSVLLNDAFNDLYTKTNNLSLSTSDILNNISDTQSDVEFLKHGLHIYEPILTLTDYAVWTDRVQPPFTGHVSYEENCIVSVYDLSKYNEFVVERPSSTSVVFLLSDTLYESPTASNIMTMVYEQNINKYVFDNIHKYKYLYLMTKTNNSQYSANVYIDILKESSIAKIYENKANYLYNLYGDFEDIPTNLVYTYKDVYIALEDGKLKYSNDNLKTWSKEIDVSSYGLIKTYHLFDNGCIAFFTHTKAYYSEDWETINEASVYEIDGVTPYNPSTYDNFTVSRESRYRKYVNGQDLYVFGNYGITDESNTRRIIWASLDNGHSYKVIYEFNISGSMTIRHVHNVIYNPNFDTFLCCTGDEANQSHVIEFKYNNGVFNDFISLGDGIEYKWAGTTFYADEVYYCLDVTPGAVMKCKYSEISDISKHEVVLDNLPNDAIGIMIGDRGDMLVTVSMYRTGTSNSPFSASVDSLNIYYSEDRKNFNVIRGKNPTNSNPMTYYGFFDVNSYGTVLCGAFYGNLATWNKLPSVGLDRFVKQAGFSKAFKPYDTSCEVIPVLAIDCDDVSIAVDETKSLVPKIYPYNATVQTFEIISYDDEIISVSDSNITGLSIGTTEVIIRSRSNYEVTKTIGVTVS